MGKMVYISTDLLEAYAVKFEKYAEFADAAAYEFCNYNDTDGAECYGANTGERDAYSHVARQLRDLIKMIEGS